MGPTDQQDAIAELVLEEAESEARLRRIVTESALDHYLPKTALGFICILPGIAIFLGICYGCVEHKQFSHIVALWLILFVLLENSRQNSRFKALVELLEVEKKKHLRTQDSSASGTIERDWNR